MPNCLDVWEDGCILGTEMRWQRLTDSAYSAEVMGILGNTTWSSGCLSPNGITEA
jgi:hypothetical protein